MKIPSFSLNYRRISIWDLVLFRSKKAGKLQLVHYQNLGKRNSHWELLVCVPDTERSILYFTPGYERRQRVKLIGKRNEHWELLVSGPKSRIPVKLIGKRNVENSHSLRLDHSLSLLRSSLFIQWALILWTCLYPYSPFLWASHVPGLFPY